MHLPEANGTAPARRLLPPFSDELIQKIATQARFVRLTPSSGWDSETEGLALHALCDDLR